MIQKELNVKMIVNEKIKKFNNKIKQNKAQYDLHRQTTKISASSSGNVVKYEFLSGKYILPEKDLLQKLLQSKDLNILCCTKN